MSSHTLFFYGTLMAPPVLHRVIWGSPTPPTAAHATLLHIRPAILHAHRRHRVKGADYPAVVPTAEEPTSSVRGTLVTGLTDGDIWRLDIFEGDEYSREKVRVRVLVDEDKEGGTGIPGVGVRGEGTEGEEVDAETYIWTAGAHRLEPKEWDFNEFVKEKMERWVGGGVGERDAGFDDVDNATSASRNDPTGGRGANGDISRQLAQQGRGDEEKILKSAV
ncbi:GGACT domain-containing protein [Pyrenophora tritici-repentis]|uniref:Putative gamma-glutamylcyclotransferase n=2 Tax=Pyrenophora tritici-repentis TaxID=45151 RepID=A0A2W1E6T1_9PLEO|nr:uncharacterized protein PTRG_10911 [Pyrenophora tritici-repentis Pt-1C-BFP]KAA8618090.1 GGACT domain-containing protein [Pyrenophora tritici-repentis]EDU43961.1 conserved hypothetical protein [Pyrenophora tritici-repentis Pt-1C-BFP]KAF7568589.1 hypothetical protein PtrM4_132020 [Pyrenophora tritici-repentis]KAI0575319.1 GGACT domain-containing protein [Pyrenophora tritici-repentis]KAI0611907.1 GGACT domain-containing protein [Pyrenophora tritici-repentis]